MSVDDTYADPTADPPAGDRHALDVYHRAIRRTIPGPWASDHWNQTSKGFVGVTYVVVDALARALSGGTVNLMECDGPSYEDDPGPEKRTALTVRRATSTPGAQESDERWHPAPPDHPARKLIEDPNPRQSVADILYEQTLQECLTGSSYTWKVPNGYGEPCEQYVIPTVLTMALPASQPYPNGAYRILPVTAAGAYAVMPSQMAAAGAVVPAEQMVVDRRPHPWISYDGYSPLQAADIQIDVLRQVDIMRQSAAQNGAEPSLVFIAPPGTKPEEVDRLQAKLDNRFAGPWNHRKIIVVTAGSSAPNNGLQIMPWSKSPGELGGEATWDQLVGFVSALFGVPKLVSGLVEAESYASYFAALKQFYTNTLLSLARRRAWRWTQQLLWPTWGKRYRYQIDLPAIDDRESLRADLDLAAKYKVIRVNELRTKLGWEPLDGDDGEKMVGEADAEKERMLLQAKLQAGASGPPQPDNADGAGSLPNRIAKAFESNGQAADALDGSVLRAKDATGHEHKGPGPGPGPEGEP